MKNRRRRARYEILIILAVSIVDGGCSPASTPSSTRSADSNRSRSSSSNGNDGLDHRTDPQRVTTGGILAPRISYHDMAATPRFFIDSDMIMQFAMQNIENLPKPLQGPAMFAMGFSQQNMKNFMSTVRSLGQMLISSLVMMAVKRLFFADLKTEADRNTASGLTDAILNIINLLNF